jgi:hypothetical protein
MVIEPGIPDWARRMFLALPKSFAPVVPTNPTRIYSAPTADLTAELAAKFPQSIAYDTTLGQFVYSNGSAWT